MTDMEARVRHTIRELRYDFRHFTVPDFIAYLKTTRQRDIILNAVPLDGGLHGLWVRAETADYVFFDRRTHPIHQVHHILHEVGHMVLGHRPRDLALVLPPALLAELTARIARAPHGHCRMWEPHETLEEREAEYFVQQLQHKILIAGCLIALTHPVTSIGELTPFTRSLGYGD